MKCLGFVLLIFAFVYHASSSSLIRNDERDASPHILFRQLLDDQSTDLSTSDKIEDLKAQIESELDHMKTNARSYLESIRMILMNFACRIGLTRFCITNDLPVVGDLPEVPVFPNDWPTTAASTPMGKLPNKENGASKPGNLAAEPENAPAPESKPEGPKNLAPAQA